MIKAEDVLNFWFHELTPKQWFGGKGDLDDSIRSRFLPAHDAASRGELFQWRESVDGRLAEIIVLDQFSRNIYRGTPEAFAQDALALVLAQELVLLKYDAEIPLDRVAFAYMPYMHSESMLMHNEAMRLFSKPGLEDNYKFEILHRDIIEKFGRYPHRNEILGRASTSEEVEFLKTHKGF